MRKWTYLPQFCFLLLIFGLYALTAPQTVQFGDTGELVTNSYLLRVPHPPGYPLYVLLYHVPIKLLSFIGPFHAASLFTIALSLLWMSVLVLNFRRDIGFCLVGVLASSLLFWRYSILPDVFNLHVTFLVLIFLVFLRPSLLERPWIIFIIGLSITNHHTVLFVFPMFVFALLKGNVRKKIFWSALFGLLSFSLYFTLLMFHPKDHGSWGNLHGFLDVINHFFRNDYGTLSLAGHLKQDETWITFMIRRCFSDYWSLLLASFYLLWKHRSYIKVELSRLSVLILCLSSYLIVFAIAGSISMNNFGETIFERFLLQPILIFFFMVFIILDKMAENVPRWLLLCFTVNIGLNLVLNFPQNDYRTNPSVEDYGLNVLNSLPSNSVLYIVGDAEAYSIYYLKNVLGVRPDVFQILPPLNAPWTAEKLQRQLPELTHAGSILTENNLLEALDLTRRPFLTNVPLPFLPKHRQLTHLGLVSMVTLSEEEAPPVKYDCEAISTNIKTRAHYSYSDFVNFDIGRYLNMRYGDCYLNKAVKEIKDGRLNEALLDLGKAKNLSPFSVKIQERICHVEDLVSRSSARCHETLDEMLGYINPQYYLLKYD